MFVFLVLIRENSKVLDHGMAVRKFPKKVEVEALAHGRQRSGDVSGQVAVDKPEVPGSRSCDHSQIGSGRLLPRYAIDPVSSISGL